ncbi:MAG: hypothetical protein FIB01_13285, partial [Gemmatimonadetes bacterium]|nr:hypothetical protein [Gemmatimonadota bacterium]
MNGRIMMAVWLAAAAAAPAAAQQRGLDGEIARRAAEINDQVVAWRRDIHQHPELGNREVRTSRLVAEHLRALGMEGRTDVAHTGVTGSASMSARSATT